TTSVSWLFGAIKVSIGFQFAKGSGKKMTKDLKLFGISLVRIKDWLRNRKKQRAELARKQRREERIWELEELKLNDPEAFERERQKALARKRERMAKASQASGTANAGSKPAETVKQAESGKPNVSVPSGEPVKADESVGKQPDEKTASEAGSHTGSVEQDEAFSEEFVDIDMINEAEKIGEVENPEAAFSVKMPIVSVMRHLRAMRYAFRRKINQFFAGTPIHQEPKKEGGKSTSGRPHKSIFSRIFEIFDDFDDYFLKLLDILDDLPLKIVTFILELPRKIWRFILRTFGQLEKTIITLKRFIDFANDYRTRGFMRQVFRTIRKILGHVFPRKIRGYLHFGFSDPSRTGITLGALAMIDPGVRGDFRYEPDFEEAVLEGQADIRGRIFLFYPLFLAIRLYFSKNTKFVIAFFRKNKAKKKIRTDDPKNVEAEVA
ncbi:MAG: hypothetical protein ACSW75_04480, partial [Lachnospiraceae bacterium]